MLLLLTSVLALMPQDTRPAIKTRCEQPRARYVAGKQSARPRKLNEMPMAQPMLTVVREIDGCPLPIVLRDDVRGALLKR